MLKNYPVPTTIKKLQRFLGLTGYYRKFIKNYSQITKPFTKLTQKDEIFAWNIDQHDSFLKLIELLTSAPILSHPVYNKTFFLNADASQYTIGANKNMKTK